MVEPVQIRRRIRRKLSALPAGVAASELLIKDELDAYFPTPVPVDQFNEAMEWNHVRGYIEFRKNGEADRIEWFLTKSGRALEGLS